MSPAQPVEDQPGVLPGAHPHPHPHPPPTPPTFFSEPLLFVTYGFVKNVFTPQELVARAKTYGFRQVAVEAENTTDEQRAEFTVVARNALLVPGVWQSQVDYGSPYQEAQGFDFYIGQSEGPGQLERITGSTPPECPHAVVGNYFAGAAALSALGYTHYIAECWIKTDGNTTPERQVGEALAAGFATAAPMAGLGENGATMDDYPDLKTFPGWSVIPAEVLLG